MTGLMKKIGLLLAAVLLLGVPWLAALDDAAGQLRTSLAGAGRPETDKARDAGRKPAEVVTLLGFGPGMTLMDVIASGGYYTEVLSVAVGPDGLVYAQNPPMIFEFQRRLLRQGAIRAADRRQAAQCRALGPQPGGHRH